MKTQKRTPMKLRGRVRKTTPRKERLSGRRLQKSRVSKFLRRVSDAKVKRAEASISRSLQKSTNKSYTSPQTTIEKPSTSTNLVASPKFQKFLDPTNKSRSSRVKRKLYHETESRTIYKRGRINKKQKMNKQNNESNSTTSAAALITTAVAIIAPAADEDDCVCIEPTVELITIDDDAADVGPGRVASSYVPIISRIQQQLHNNRGSSRFTTVTSTPTVSAKPGRLVTSLGSPSYASVTALGYTVPQQSNAITPLSNSNGAAIFFEDISRIADKSNNNITTATTPTTGKSISGRKKRIQKTRMKNRRAQEVSTNVANVVDDDVIVLDDEMSLRPLVQNRKSQLNAEDSVIFVSETTANRSNAKSQMPTQQTVSRHVSNQNSTNNLPAFIPLESTDVPNPIHIVPAPKTPKSKQPNNDLFTRSEKKQLDAYNDNAYNPSSGGEVTTGKRMVIIDGSNVAFNHALNKEFSVKGLKICLDYFEKMGHEVKAIVPQFRMNKYKSSAPDELIALHSAGKIVFTPCKNIPGSQSICYDDRFVLQLACELDAAIVSNDNYRDLINENSAFKKIIENRVIGYTWCNDIFILPKDPYGRWGPSLHNILNR